MYRTTNTNLFAKCSGSGKHLSAATIATAPMCIVISVIAPFVKQFKPKSTKATTTMRRKEDAFPSRLVAHSIAPPYKLQSRADY
ncbi:MAG: hypothetical protein NVS4B11_11630 [Ktedonobacteraceae bacterium]